MLRHCPALRLSLRSGKFLHCLAREFNKNTESRDLLLIVSLTMTMVSSANHDKNLLIFQTQGNICNIFQIVVTMFLLIGAEVVGVTFAFTYRDNVSTLISNIFTTRNKHLTS